MKPGRPRLQDDTIPRHIDQRKLPRGCYWDARSRCWYTILVIQSPELPKPRQKWRRVAGPGATLADLHARLQELTEDDHSTVAWLLGLFHQSERFKTKIAPSTQKQYEKARRAIVDRQMPGGVLGKVKLGSITRHHWQMLIDSIAAGGHPTKANHILRYSRVAFRWGMNRGLAPAQWVTNPADGVEPAKERKAQRMPSTEAFQAVLAYARAGAAKTPHTAGSVSPYLWASMQIAYKCRLRGVEVATLTDAHDTSQGLQTNRRKGSFDNIVGWSPDLREAWDALLAHRAAAWARHSGLVIPIRPEARYIVVSQDGTPLTKSGLDTAWQRLILKAIKDGVITPEQRFSMHGLKHRGVTDTKGNKAEKQNGSGHKSAQMLHHYDHELPLVRPAGE